MPAPTPAPADEQISSLPGLKSIALALVLHQVSPKLFGIADTPLVVGNPLVAAIVSVVIAMITFAYFDFISSASAASSVFSLGLHQGAVRWLNKGAAFRSSSDPNSFDRMLILTNSLVYAISDELLLHYLFVTLVPPFPLADEILGASLPTGFIMSIVVYAWNRGGDVGEDRGVAAVLGAAHALSAWSAGLVAGIATNFLVSVATKSLYFHQLSKTSRSARAKGKERKELNPSGNAKKNKAT